MSKDAAESNLEQGNRMVDAGVPSAFLLRHSTDFTVGPGSRACQHSKLGFQRCIRVTDISTHRAASLIRSFTAARTYLLQGIPCPSSIWLHSPRNDGTQFRSCSYIRTKCKNQSGTHPKLVVVSKMLLLLLQILGKDVRYY